ncbi:MAG: hypothetical protein ABS95_00915 [Verrucomicrobia bacterium SCN 57-15]|nr:MAG: hypothetical protein ABS95_00915 [Verrucomicrobia bacterium SCN 57-15]
MSNSGESKTEKPTAESGRKKSSRPLAIYRSPIRLLVLIALTMFVTHALAMVMFALLPQFRMWIESLIESVLLLILLFPVLYFFSFRPLLLHIAEREEAEAAMIQSEYKYRQLFENLSDAAFLIDVETGRILDTNKQAESLLGRTRGEIMGMNQSKLYPPEKSEESRSQLARLSQQNGPGDYESEILGNGGKVRLVHVSGTPVVLHGRKLVLELFRDMTMAHI